MIENPNEGVQNTSSNLDSNSENSSNTLSSMLSGTSNQNHDIDVLVLERQALERERLELERERLRVEKEKSKSQYSSISEGPSLELQRLELEREKLRIEQAKLSQSQATPVINIINQNTNQNVNNSPDTTVVPVPRKNNVAFIIGLIASFFGFFGVAHMVNGRVLSGFGHMLRGFIWLAIMGGIIGASAGAGAIIAFPLHIWFMIRNANRGSLPPVTR